MLAHYQFPVALSILPVCQDQGWGRPSGLQLQYIEE